ncbi:hypothetical protein [Streptomyces sp. NPDC053541]|uniref:hypothetical protein n=1 Tax=Streptomyces sp. NPDC053541 TaxID=3365709 RepID=UPI0037CDABF6
MSTPPPQHPAYGPQPQGPYQQPTPYPGPYQGPYQGPPPGPYQAPGAWGPSPAPVKKNRTGLILGLTAAGIAGVLLLSWIGNGGLRGTGSDSAYPAATHRLVLPKTLLDGRYALGKDQSQQAAAGLAGSSEAVIKDPEGVVGQYAGSGEDGVGILVVTGLYGRIKEPDTARRNILKGAAGGKGTTVLVPPKDVTPPGADTEVTCQVLATEQSEGGPVTYPVCAWADANTNAAVAEMSVATATTDPAALDLAKAARTTLTIRDEMRRPLN